MFRSGETIKFTANEAADHCTRIAISATDAVQLADRYLDLAEQYAAPLPIHDWNNDNGYNVCKERARQAAACAKYAWDIIDLCPVETADRIIELLAEASKE